MRIIIDVTAAQFLLILNPQHPPHHYVEGDATVSRTYSALTRGQLQRLYRNTTGYELASTNYNSAIQACKTLAIRLLSTTDPGGFENGYSLEKEDG
jgi:hypothetical protein